MHSSISVILLLSLLPYSLCGRPWPYPQVYTSGNETVSVSPPPNFNFRVVGESNEVLQNGIIRYQHLIFPSLHPSHIPVQISFITRNITPPIDALSVLVINVASSETSLHLGVNESYTLSIDYTSQAPDAPVEATITAPTVWGALRGLETFSQLIDWVGGDSYQITSFPVHIQDHPRFPFRGLLIDTARHWLPVDVMLRIVDSMEWNKMNVLHWHLVDAESFPVELRTHPTLSQKGAWAYPQAVYTEKDLQRVVDYAYERGVNVIPEIDGPGHAYSWSHAYPNITIKCPNLVQSHRDYPWVNSVPLDMRSDFMYGVLFEVLQEVAQQFPNKYFHFGGDEVSSACLNEDPSVKQWMADQGMNTSTYDPLVNFYTQKLLDWLAKSTEIEPIFWQEVFEAAVTDPALVLPKSTIIDVWIQDGGKQLMRDIITSGTQAILSAGWYVDQQLPGETHFLAIDAWKDFYLNEPMEGLDDLSDDVKSLVLGGEACEWGEENDAWNIFSRIWPKASATAERLWSPRGMNDTVAATPRLMEHRCRMLVRGVPVSPIRPDYCPNVDYNWLLNITKPPHKEKEIVHGKFPVGLIIAEVVIFVALVAAMVGVYIWKMKLLTTKHTIYSPLDQD